MGLLPTPAVPTVFVNEFREKNGVETFVNGELTLWFYPIFHRIPRLKFSPRAHHPYTCGIPRSLAVVDAEVTGQHEVAAGLLGVMANVVTGPALPRPPGISRCDILENLNHCVRPDLAWFLNWASHLPS